MQPTAQALLADVAATLLRPLPNCPKDGLGLGTRCQAVPFQCRIKLVSGEVPWETAPTAQALRPEVTATEVREALPVMLGLGTCFQLAPFQCRISVLPNPEPNADSEPTDQALVAEEALTAVRLPAPALGTRSQLVPFQCRIRLWPLLVPPTAQALLAEVAATARSSPPGRPEFGTCFQLVPFQCAISGLGLRNCRRSRRPRRCLRRWRPLRRVRRRC